MIPPKIARVNISLDLRTDPDIYVSKFFNQSNGKVHQMHSASSNVKITRIFRVKKLTLYE